MTTTITRISQLWDQIETWGFREDIKDIIADDDKDDDDNEDDKDKEEEDNEK